MPIDPDWMLKIAGVILGAVGSALGLYNFRIARHERQQKIKNAYAITVLWLEPIIQLLLGLPLSNPDELASTDPKILSVKLDDIEKLVDNSKEKLVTLVPEFAAKVVELRSTSKALREQLSIDRPRARRI